MHAESYAHGEPLPGRVAADRITREYRAAGPYRTLRCTCGHYTIHAPVPGPAT